MSYDFVTAETASVRADYLAERDGFEPEYGERNLWFESISLRQPVSRQTRLIRPVQRLGDAHRDDPRRDPADFELHRRAVCGPGFGERPTGNFRAPSVSGYGEIGYGEKYGMFTATPFAGLEFASLNTGAFTENNQGLPSVIGLSYASTTTTLLPSFALRRRRASSPYSAASRIAP